MSYKKIIATCYPAAISVRGYGDLHLKGQISGARGDADKDQLNTTIDDNEEERELCSLCWASREGSTVAVSYNRTHTSVGYDYKILRT